MTVALGQLRGRSVGYRLCRDYYEGRHKLAFATDKFRTAFGSMFRAFADNLCPSVCDVLADRLTLIGFGVEEGTEAAAAEAWRIWTANRMARRSGEVHLEALVSGDAYVIVWPDKSGDPILYPNSGAAMTVKYDAESPGTIVWAAKVWTQDDGRIRVNLYYADRIEKYVARGKTDALPEKSSSFEELPVEGEPWPLPNEWGQVPVFHFANNTEVGQFGWSELSDVVPLQDALNKCLADMLVAMEYVALPQRWATGLEVDIDEATGKPKVPFTPGVERLWAVGDESVRFGQFDPANLDQFLNVQEKFRKEIAVVSRTPLHFIIPLTGGFPSGESLKTAEASFLAKALDRQVAFGDVWEDVMGLALLMSGVPEARLSALWKDPTPRSDKEQAEIALLKAQAGVSDRQILSELGYSPEQIEQMEVEKSEQKASLGERVLAGFERGEDDEQS